MTFHALNRARKPNFTEEDQLILAELVKADLPTISSKECTEKVVQAKKRVWSEITKRYNIANPTNPREASELRALFDRMKSKAKKEASAYQRSLKMTGGGPKPRSPSAACKEVMNLIPQVCIVIILTPVNVLSTKHRLKALPIVHRISSL